MGNYYFKNNIKVEDYIYTFLCGVSFNSNQISYDKREILGKFINSKNEDIKPIILEKKFIIRNGKTKKKLSYSEAGFSNLYQVEMLVNYLSDINFIILESISTGAEAGMFLGEPQTQEKTCLLIPDEVAIEEDKLGAFLKLSFKNSNVKIMTFYPQIKKFNISQNVCGWHTYFNNNIIGKYLGNDIMNFILKKTSGHLVAFSSNRKKLSEGNIYYKINDDSILKIEICPRTLIICVGALLNCDDYQDIFFSKEGHTMRNIERMITSWLQSTFINSIAELNGIKAKKCKISVHVNMEISINRAIGMILYLLSAAELLSIEKMEDYDCSSKVKFGRKMVTIDGIENKFFYNKYIKCIEKMVEKKIII